MQPLPPQLELPEGESLLPERPALRRVRSRRSARSKGNYCRQQWRVCRA